ncbi:MAG: hypothetical protein ACRDYV_15600 [Acidimicrobiia bacterium]
MIHNELWCYVCPKPHQIINAYRWQPPPFENPTRALLDTLARWQEAHP